MSARKTTAKKASSSRPSRGAAGEGRKRPASPQRKVPARRDTPPAKAPARGERAGAPKAVPADAGETAAHQTVEEYIRALSGWQASAVRSICNIVRATAPKAKESIKWAQPVYEQEGPVCYLKAFNACVNFGFWRGAELSDPKRLLRGEGDKMRHVKLSSERDVDPKAFAAFVKQAVELNRRLGDPTRG
jgi:hypothetical protein